MDLRTRSAATSIQMAISAIADEVDQIGLAHPRDGFPHAQLVAALPSREILTELSDGFVAENMRDPTEQTGVTLKSALTLLSNVRETLQQIRAAVEWSSRFTAIDWWVAERCEQLGLHNKIVLLTPGRLGEFKIERNSRFRQHLTLLSQSVLCTPEGEPSEEITRCIDGLEHFHLLAVPASEGISPTWRPLVLGHELAHLKYDTDWIFNWISGQAPRGASDLIKDAIQQAKIISTSGEGRAIWLDKLANWLAEIACDSVGTYYYGQKAGASALSSMLSIRGGAGPTDSHPETTFRLAVQRCQDQGDLEQYRPASEFSSADDQAQAGAAVFAKDLRDTVWRDLEGTVPIDRPQTAQLSSLTSKALDEKVLPAADQWPSDLTTGVATVESALVQGLWDRREALLESLPESTTELRNDESLVGQALDGLEFLTRFHRSRPSIPHPKSEKFLPNVLWLSHSGVKRSRDDTEGLSSHDLRLGRQFIVFERNEISDLNSLGEPLGNRSPIQRSVEVGWGDQFVLHPSEMVLAVTFEQLRLDHTCIAQVLSRSSLGRLGLLSATAVHINPGYVGCLTLELVNLASVPLRLSPGQRIAQIVPFPVTGTGPPYEGSYQNAVGPQFSLAHEDWDAPILRGLRKSQLGD